MGISMWDSKEPHRYNVLPKFFYTKAHGIVFMYSINGKFFITLVFKLKIDPYSFEKLQKWVYNFLGEDIGNFSEFLL